MEDLGLVPLEGGGESEDRQFMDAMGLVAEAYREAVMALPFGHPRSAWMRRAWRDARICAGLPPLAVVPVEQQLR